ncbi:hypothetical protein ACFFQW_28985 [Umezawaea endophytica]|uniref:Uncharacterized protein n=1 Tax=Umezawaea endophytica TaxID=1654476 RepID=A0A9X2VXQ9_9PSEU|nr:hypothetical protein [Umezawaea endophytica]MCS7484132.1 hypothetical protein [Umezawaea endophytica]
MLTGGFGRGGLVVGVAAAELRADERGDGDDLVVVGGAHGEVIDYDVIEDHITADTGLLRVTNISYDEWSGEPVRQHIKRRTGVPMYPVPQTYKGVTHGMTELMT